MEIEEIIDINQPIYAHERDGEKETLSEHTRLCLKYFGKLVSEKKLKRCFDNLFEAFFKDDCASEMAYDLLRNMVKLHDIGKINPVFQQKKMKNIQDQRAPYQSVNGSNHSLLSSVIYIDRELSLLRNNNYDKTILKKIKGLVVINAYIISRHHSGLKSLHDFSGELACGGQCYDIVKELCNIKDPWFYGMKFLTTDNISNVHKYYDTAIRNSDRDAIIAAYIYSRLAYSVLAASDYYSTTEFINEIEIGELGQIGDIDELVKDFEASDIMKSIRRYEKESYGRKNEFADVTDINVMRSEMFLDAEKSLQEIRCKDIFYLEAPTGSGKSNVAIDLSMKLLDEDIRKIYYIYPYNTLIEQNINVLNKSFAGENNTIKKMAVINALSPIVADAMNNDDENNSEFFQRAFLDRQFQNYPMILTTHVSLFCTMFGTKRENLFPFLQLTNSVIVLDEIQSYKNTIWSEIIIFLEHFAKLLNMKIIIMSATLPNLSMLSEEGKESVNILHNRNKYFQHKLFAGRVKISYELLDAEFSMDTLLGHVIANQGNVKILIEFIRKKSAYEFYRKLEGSQEITSEILLMTGDDNVVERKKIIDKVNRERACLILVATQIVEAGIDIDMDIGYKDISKLDSEEQFIGRINRSCKREGTVYFFNCDSCTSIYRDDERTNIRYTLENEEMQKILDTKDFGKYYSHVMELVRRNHRDLCSESGLADFVKNKVRSLDYVAVEERMKLIDDDDWKVSVFFNLKTNGENNNTSIDPATIWSKYKKLLRSDDMDYAERMIRLSEVKSKLYNFIYEIPGNMQIDFNDSIGDLFYVEEGDQYFRKGKIDLDAITKGGMFI
jgi:CRISPR-associated endonuclease/helicase Cas3